MFAVVVQFEIAPGKMDAFHPLMLENARASLEQEPGCLRFDVLREPERANTVFLYEIYTDRAAFDAHLAAAHFKTFDAKVADMVDEKVVSTWSEVFS